MKKTITINKKKTVESTYQQAKETFLKYAAFIREKETVQKLSPEEIDKLIYDAISSNHTVNSKLVQAMIEPIKYTFKQRVKDFLEENEGSEDVGVKAIREIWDKTYSNIEEKDNK